MEAGTNFQILSLILQIKLQNRLLGSTQTRCSAQNCAGYASLWMLSKLIFQCFSYLTIYRETGTRSSGFATQFR